MTAVTQNLRSDTEVMTRVAVAVAPDASVVDCKGMGAMLSIIEEDGYGKSSLATIHRVYVYTYRYM
jgi:hypothetical protein